MTQHFEESKFSSKEVTLGRLQFQNQQSLYDQTLTAGSGCGLQRWRPDDDIIEIY